MTSVSVSLLEDDALGLELALEGGVVLDDAVVDDGDLAVAAATCGWALPSVAGPCVAQRVWLMPRQPGAGLRRAGARPGRRPGRPSCAGAARSPVSVARPALS